MGNRLADDLAGETLFFAGVNHCVLSTGDGVDLVWLTPVDRFRHPLHWSVFAPDPSATFGDFDGDGDFEGARTAVETAAGL